MFRYIYILLCVSDTPFIKHKVRPNIYKILFMNSFVDRILSLRQKTGRVGKLQTVTEKSHKTGIAAA